MKFAAGDFCGKKTPKRLVWLEIHPLLIFLTPSKLNFKQQFPNVKKYILKIQ